MDDKEPIPSLTPETLEPLKPEELDQLISSLQISNVNLDDYIVDTSSMNYTFNGSSSSYGTITIGASGSSGSFLTSAGSNGTSWTTPTWSNITAGHPSLHVSGEAEFESDVKIKGVSILETLQKIEKRLSILRPDPEKLEHFAALKKAYEHYKTLEALCELPEKEEE